MDPPQPPRRKQFRPPQQYLSTYALSPHAHHPPLADHQQQQPGPAHAHFSPAFAPPPIPTPTPQYFPPPALAYAQPPPPPPPPQDPAVYNTGFRPPPLQWPQSIPAHSLRLMREYTTICNSPGVQSQGAVALADFKVFGMGVITLHHKIEDMYRALWQRAGEEARRDVGWDWVAEAEEGEWGIEKQFRRAKAEVEVREPVQVPVQERPKMKKSVTARGPDGEGEMEWVFDGVRWRPVGREGGEVKRDGEGGHRRRESGHHGVRNGERGSAKGPPIGLFPPPAVAGSKIHSHGQELPKKVRKHRAKEVDGTHGAAQDTGGVASALEASGVKQKHRRKSQKMRDPDAPKHPKSAFIFFNSTENRQKLKDENPEMVFKDIGALMGERWKTMPAAEREGYEKQAAEEKEKYLAAKAAYIPKVSADAKTTGLSAKTTGSNVRTPGSSVKTPKSVITMEDQDATPSWPHVKTTSNGKASGILGQIPHRVPNYMSGVPRVLPSNDMDVDMTDG
ncbi:hypothetical protein BU16DRAFT_621309 [Lophium mytilinum]|uniref:HMG box domain-containing protein n=1 Tax=Lophium mytilinum TaxID=390894 RepID=A0A6A6QJE8_9PEZI|nr:hypothetical protein BU16DRAFT_621309 [Lophium mytilinum]